MLDSVATLAGPLLAAVLVEFTGVAVVFAVAAGASLAAAALLLRLRYDAPPRPPAPREVHFMADVAEGVRTIVRNRDLALLIGLDIAQTFTRGALTVFTVVVALDLLRIGEPGVGTLTAAVGSGCCDRLSRCVPAGGIASARSTVWHWYCVVGSTHRTDPALSIAGNRPDLAGMCGLR